MRALLVVFGLVIAGVAGIVALVVLASAVVGGDGGRETTAPTTTDAGPALPGGPGAAACYESDPSAEHLRAVLEAAGGFGALELGRAVGAFDVVTELDDTARGSGGYGSTGRA